MNQVSKRGFTIVELLVVIVVIAILASVTIVAYLNIQERAREAVARGDLRNLSTQMELHKAAHGVYPSTRAALEPIIRGASIYDETRWNGDANTRATRGYLFCFEEPRGSTYKIVAFEPLYTFLHGNAQQYVGDELLYTGVGGGIHTAPITWQSGSTFVAANMCRSVGANTTEENNESLIWSYNIPTTYAP